MGEVKRIRFSDEQIVGVLKEAEAGTKVSELCRRYGMSGATFYSWRGKYAGLDISEMRRLRHLEDENRRLKTVVADQALDILALKDELARESYDRSLFSGDNVSRSPGHTEAGRHSTTVPFGARTTDPTYGMDEVEAPNGARREGLGLFVLEPTAAHPRANANGALGIRQRRRRSRHSRWLRNNALTIVVVVGLLSLAWHIARP